MKEWKIQNKVTSLMGKLGMRHEVATINREREMMNLANEITQEIARATDEYQRYICKLVHLTLKNAAK